jgi:tripartite-type tricarboxylate transporter receptor subunit TctC
VPTTDEVGFPGIYISTWLGLWAPKNTPIDIVAKVNRTALAAVADPEAHRRIADLGMQVSPPERLTPAAFAVFHRAEVESGIRSSRRPASRPSKLICRAF